MNRDLLIRKAVAKLSQKKITDEEMKDIQDNLRDLITRKRENSLVSSKLFLEYFGNIVDNGNYSKMEIQEILAKAKSLGIIKKSIKDNKYMEKAWRAILKNYRLQGFLLES